jgi:acetyl-CoA C-acetyltransferase
VTLRISPFTDGAAAILLASEQWAEAHGHSPQAWLIDAESAAVDFFGPHAEGLLMAGSTQSRGCWHAMG